MINRGSTVSDIQGGSGWIGDGCIGERKCSGGTVQNVDARITTIQRYGSVEIVVTVSIVELQACSVGSADCGGRAECRGQLH